MRRDQPRPPCPSFESCKGCDDDDRALDTLAATATTRRFLPLSVLMMSSASIDDEMQSVVVELLRLAADSD